MLFAGVVDCINFLGSIFWYGKMNTIIDHKSGTATLITIFTSVSNASMEIPKTIGLYMINKFHHFTLLVILVMALSVILLIVLYPTAIKIDNIPDKHFLLDY